jgi:hypothetical protein
MKIEGAFAEVDAVFKISLEGADHLGPAKAVAV